MWWSTGMWPLTAQRVSDTNGSGVDCTLMLSTNSSEATCTIDRIAVDSGATCQVLYQERAYHKSAHLQIADNLVIAENAKFNAWAIGNSYLTIAVDAGATVENRGSLALSGTEFDNAGRIDNQGSLALEVAGFNNNGTLENSGTMRLFAANLENHSTFSNHATLAIGNAGTFENAGGMLINEDEAAQIAIGDGGRFLNDAASTLENHAPLTLDGKGTFTNADFADTHCTHHSFSGDAQPSYTEPQTCYICGQAVYETDSVAPDGDAQRQRRGVYRSWRDQRACRGESRRACDADGAGWRERAETAVVLYFRPRADRKRDRSDHRLAGDQPGRADAECCAHRARSCAGCR